MAHVIGIKLNGAEDNSAVLTIDNATVNINNDLATLLWNSIVEFLNNYCIDCKWNNDGNAVYKMSNLVVKVRRAKDEIEFDFEER